MLRYSFYYSANLSGVSLPLAYLAVGQNSTSVSLGFGADNYGGYLGGD
jgi:SNF family Na+-dependent transporter